MSRLDFFTIFVVALCILAIIFLIFKATELAKGDSVTVPETTGFTDDSADITDEEDLYDSDEYNDETLSGEANSDKNGGTSAGGSGEDDDADLEEDEMDMDGADEAEATTKTIKEPEVISTDASLGKYLVIAGTFKIRAGAETLVRKLRNAGYPKAKMSIFDKGTYAVVLVDRFTSKSEAQSLASRLTKGGTEAYVQSVKSSAN